MDVDFGENSTSGGGGGEDITSELLQKFSCMNTNDHDTLIEQFKILLGDKCSESNAEFWLDMNNWNLQAAVCAYFDYECNTSSLMVLKLPSIQIIANTDLNDELPPNSSFVYSCTVHNTGDEPWPLGCSLRYCGGTQMCTDERILLPQLAPGQNVEMRLSLRTPDLPGLYQSQWRPATITGQFFGETLFVIVNVNIIDDLSSVTQKLSNAHLGLQCTASTTVSSILSPIFSANGTTTTNTTLTTGALNGAQFVLTPGGGFFPTPPPSLVNGCGIVPTATLTEQQSSTTPSSNTDPDDSMS